MEDHRDFAPPRHATTGPYEKSEDEAEKRAGDKRSAAMARRGHFLALLCSLLFISSSTRHPSTVGYFSPPTLLLAASNRT